MPIIRNVLVTVAIGLFSAAAGAAEVRPFTGEAFAIARAENRPVLIDIHATWCSTCRRQAQILERLFEDDAFEALLVLKLDWDEQRVVARELGAPRQSTLIAFRGTDERGRSVADTREASIRDLLLEAVRD